MATPITTPGPIAQGFGQTPQLIITQGYLSGAAPPPSFTATAFEISVGPAGADVGVAGGVGE